MGFGQLVHASGNGLGGLDQRTCLIVVIEKLIEVGCAAEAMDSEAAVEACRFEDPHVGTCGEGRWQLELCDLRRVLVA